MAVFEDAARTEVAVAPPESPMHFAAQRHLYVISLVQDCLDRLDVDTENAVTDTVGATRLDELPADTHCYRETNAIAVVHAGEDITTSEASADVNTLIMLFDFNDHT